jgi:hypothetical protein
LASWEGGVTKKKESTTDDVSRGGSKREEFAEGRLRLSYTINLNLPATTEVEVFNSIFKSLRENLLRDP